MNLYETIHSNTIHSNLNIISSIQHTSTLKLFERTIRIHTLFHPHKYLIRRISECRATEALDRNNSRTNTIRPNSKERKLEK